MTSFQGPLPGNPTQMSPTDAADPPSRISLASFAPSGTIDYEVDGRGLRQTRDDGALTGFLWSTARSLPMLMADGVNAYIYGPSVAPIAQVDLSDGKVSYLHNDALGSIRASTDDQGVVLGTRTFTEFGSTASSTGAIGTPFGFTGNWTDHTTGLVHLRAREYDPQTGQFLTVDPKVEETRQPYAYAGNNPLQFTDHTGLDYWADFWGQVGTDAAAFGAGALNSVSFGLSGLIMSEVVPSYDCFVETNSGFYAGGEITGTIATALVPGGLAASGIRIAAGGVRNAARGVDFVNDVSRAARADASARAGQIAAGHGFEKHVISQGQYPYVRTRDHHADLVRDTATNGQQKFLERGRMAYWHDESVLFRNPADKDGGTMFRPDNGFAYFEELE